MMSICQKLKERWAIIKKHVVEISHNQRVHLNDFLLILRKYAGINLSKQDIEKLVEGENIIGGGGEEEERIHYNRFYKYLIRITK
jgi:hypothetical protein